MNKDLHRKIPNRPLLPWKIYSFGRKKSSVQKTGFWGRTSVKSTEDEAGRGAKRVVSPRIFSFRPPFMTRLIKGACLIWFLGGERRRKWRRLKESTARGGMRNHAVLK